MAASRSRSASSACPLSSSVVDRLLPLRTIPPIARASASITRAGVKPMIWNSNPIRAPSNRPAGSAVGVPTAGADRAGADTAWGWRHGHGWGRRHGGWRLMATAGAAIFITADTATGMATGTAVIIADIGVRPVVTSAQEFT